MEARRAHLLSNEFYSKDEIQRSKAKASRKQQCFTDQVAHQILSSAGANSTDKADSANFIDEETGRRKVFIFVFESGSSFGQGRACKLQCTLNYKGK
jgi:hypothetical protein